MLTADASRSRRKLISQIDARCELGNSLLPKHDEVMGGRFQKPIAQGLSSGHGGCSADELEERCVSKEIEIGGVWMIECCSNPSR